MTVDKQGNIYLTARGLKPPGVLVIEPAGKEVAFIPPARPIRPIRRRPSEQRDLRHRPIKTPCTSPSMSACTRSHESRGILAWMH